MIEDERIPARIRATVNVESGLNDGLVTPIVLFFVALAVAAVAPRLAAQDKPDLDKFILARPGTLPIILSAPHGGRTPIPDVPTRRGEGVSKFTVVRDENTLELVIIGAPDDEDRGEESES